MISKAFVLLSLVAVGLCASVPNPTQWQTQLVDGSDLPTDMQEYLSRQFESLPEDENELELIDPPMALQEVALSEMGSDEHGGRMKRAVKVCRYVAITNRRTKKTLLVIRCPK